MWNAHTSVGNILGSLVSAAMLKRGGDGWGNAFVVNGVLTIACGWLVHNFLVVAPEDAGLPSPHGVRRDGVEGKASWRPIKSGQPT